MLSQEQIVDHLREFKANPKNAFYSVGQRDYSVLRDGYLDQNLNLTPRAYRLLEQTKGGMRNDYLSD